MIQLIALRNGHKYTNPKICFNSIPEMFKLYQQVQTELDPSEQYNLYYTMAHHSGCNESDQPVRSAATFEYQTVLGYDIDKGADTSKAMLYAETICEVLQVPSTHAIVIVSGNGVHVLFNLKTPIRNAKYFKENKAAYVRTFEAIHARLKDLDLPGECDHAIFDPARIMRFPGTDNRKPNKPTTRCELVQFSNAVVDLNINAVSGMGEISKENVSPQEIRARYPKPDFEEMMRECLFMKECTESAATFVHEPEAFDAFSLLSAMPAVSKVQVDGVSRSPSEVARYIYDSATSSVSLRKSSFETKWENAGKYGCRKCETIASHFDGCKQCPHFGKIQTPLALKSPEHIGSEQNGYWIFNSKGIPVNPHYSDLCKVFGQQHNYFCTEGAHIYLFNKTHYNVSSELYIKNWCERTVTPSEHLMERHRNEFVSKVKATGLLTQQSQDNLMHVAVNNKMNLANGVLDIQSGELLPHSPVFGFDYVLPFSYTEGASSEFFVDWLAQILSNDTDLMETVLDVMAYCLWPRFDDHSFVFLTGSGKNGKSTLLSIIQELVGKNNYTALSLTQITKDKFAPAELEGKLVNLCEEAGGASVSLSEGNTLKAITGGGDIFIQRKGLQGYSYKNKAKFLFSANVVPDFKEKDDAIMRRLIAIPFNHRIEVCDETIGIRLRTTEIPSIFSMLVDRLKKNLEINNGVFKITRGSKSLADAQKRFFSTNDTVCKWGEACVESGYFVGKEAFLQKAEAYGAYKIWCDSVGYTPGNYFTFCRSMETFVVSEAALADSGTKKVGTKNVAVWKHTRLKQGETV